ncbi:AAA family ATPase [Nonomuraea ferruginea]
MISPVLVGREKELARLVALVTTAPAVAVIEGEAGIGKSRLAAELLGDPAVAGMRVLSGSCVQIREPFPLGPIVEALRGRAPDLAGAELTPVAGALRDLLPELAGVLPEKPRLPDDRAAERHRLFRGARRGHGRSRSRRPARGGPALGGRADGRVPHLPDVRAARHAPRGADVPGRGGAERRCARSPRGRPTRSAWRTWCCRRSTPPRRGSWRRRS